MMTEKKLSGAGLRGQSAGETSLCTVGKSGSGLTYCGYDVADLAENATFEEVAYLLFNGELPNSAELAQYKAELLAMREVLEIKPKANQQLQKSAVKQTQVKRKLLAAKVNQQSTALANAKVSQTVASDALSTHNTQTIRLSDEEVIASGEGEEQYADSQGLANVRSEMKLRQTLEASKARLYALYNRALRKDPLLKGKVVFNIEIQPNGAISEVFIESSELDNAKLERQLLIILRSIDFGAEDVELMTTVWAIEFLPR